MRIFDDIEQGSPEWRAARAGLATASEFKSILAKGEGKTRRTYMLRLAGELLTGEPAETFESADMIRGREMEAEARAAYAFMYDADPVLIGFIRNDHAGCSPDALLGDAGLLEIKTKKPALLIDALLKDEFCAEHKAQCQGQLWVSEREWVDLAVYWPGLPLFVKRATRDEGFIRSIAEAVDAFNAELAEVVAKVRRYGQPMERAA